ncbi:MAG: alpha-amylase family glycosyl hydrolase [Chloroflexi bacterium]|nr:alpha-amylase family glycosyl hydrolase [Chloroflexota bacterium]
MEFHISRHARERYQFDRNLFGLTGNVVFTDFHAARLFTQKMNQKRDLIHHPEQAVRAGQINAMGLIDEILHYVIALYREQANPQGIAGALEALDQRLGKPSVDQTLRLFIEEFPPLAVYSKQMTVAEYLSGATENRPNRELVLEELVMLWLANSNPAMAIFVDLFDDSRLEQESAYPQIPAILTDFFETQPRFGPDNQNLIEMLRSPALASPYSLSGQLEFIRQRWATLLGRFLYRLLGSLDLIKEEERIGFLGPGPTTVLDYLGAEFEPERFSQDRDWMPTLVLIAKNTYVWLDQLSKKYQRSIHHIDEIPDEELSNLRRWGFSGLWLIGVWERSKASEKIKQLCGNPEAVASAYSLAGYQIAGDLGGEAAYHNLRERAWRHGIRLASDMVPNHMGIDSNWVVDHPDWFISLDYSPFPSYTFNGPDLSDDSRVGIHIEDHYYSRTDAAVGFKRVDRWTGSEKFIYHGNDGTSMPWNDTAQLNYLIPEVREAVIQTILHVARLFPIIRFDAAMTLTKKHYQRLWFPEPGTGGAIPSRADYGMRREEFNRLMPAEFWREVVDRVAQEAPDTLLLAEAFWLMESYFVRSLGMHRVYNSAFMNMLRNEENSKYRLVIKNTLEFDPEILKRFVNFMNNPDERTAVDQFGNGDKYFGICTLMASMPGLPMFGHGQIEGYTEKYGMEFRRAYWDEHPDDALIHRHEREIFPLLHRRYLFANVEHFRLYDFFTPEGYVNEDVFAYSNGVGSERALVVYQNKFAHSQGWVRTSTAHAVKTADGTNLAQDTLGEGLALHADDGYYCIFRDQHTGLEYIRPSRELFDQGLFIDLNAYQYYVFLDFKETRENEWGHYGRVNAYLNGRGVPNVEEALKELLLQPIHQPFKEMFNADVLGRLIALSEEGGFSPEVPALLAELEEKSVRLLAGVKQQVGGSGDVQNLARQIREAIHLLIQLPNFEERLPFPNSQKYQEALAYLRPRDENKHSLWIIWYGWALLHNLGQIAGPEGYEERSRSWIDEWLLGQIIARVSQELGAGEGEAWQNAMAIQLLTTHQSWSGRLHTSSPYQALETWLLDENTRHFLGINRYQDVLWFNKEAFEQFIRWMFTLAVLHTVTAPGKTASEMVEEILASHKFIARIEAAGGVSGYQVEQLLDALKKVRRLL